MALLDPVLLVLLGNLAEHRIRHSRRYDGQWNVPKRLDRRGECGTGAEHLAVLGRDGTEERKSGDSLRVRGIRSSVREVLPLTRYLVGHLPELRISLPHQPEERWRIEENHARCVVRIPGRIDLYVKSTKGMPDKQIRTRNGRLSEERVQLVSCPAAVPRKRPGFALPIACPLVGADTRDLSNLLLQRKPLLQPGPDPNVKDDGRRTLTLATDVELVGP